MGDDNVIQLDIPTTADLPPKRILKEATKVNLKMVIVIGWTEDDELCVAHSHCDTADNVFLLEKAKMEFLSDE